ncbi:Pentatricopeptide repeat-containing protein [Cynara cardunculus var. scolymus]|uniref:Pentatricopeptide repeat-containing protein n=1 Tax=Cynara cardunculus var. scolymus TaxID=59895 RepID=A0A124SCT0_CYNCS|nr:Pentatricopeptide repeat-containing protein [Cynara cardunculus var. scolymus]
MRVLQQIHSYILTRSLPFSTLCFSLSKIISHCALSPVGNILYAERLLFQAPNPNIFSWNSVIRGFSKSQISPTSQSISIFRSLIRRGCPNPNTYTLAFVLKACMILQAFQEGQQVHSYVIRHGFSSSSFLQSSFVGFYAKCEEIMFARKVFDEIPERNMIAWSTMISGYAKLDMFSEALDSFISMQKAGVVPDEVTMASVISACAGLGALDVACVHGQLVSEGRRRWASMLELGIEPSVEHYSCMVDIFCRANLFEEAYTFIRNMPIEPDPVIWRTFLVACKKNKDMVRGEIASQQLLESEPSNPENYALLSSFYAACSEWSKMGHIRKQMRDKGMKTVPGCSSIEVDGFINEFVLGDWSHPESNEIREVLGDILKRLNSLGYRPDVSGVLHDVEDEAKKEALCEHSERLAIAYGIMKTKAPVVIRVVKNLRVCDDCHEVTKIISAVYEREIVVRDRVRFHRFVGGSCSCKDIW